MLRRGIDSELPILRRITAEYICQSSAVTAVLLQIAQSGVGRGVGRHSNLSTRLLERYENTAAFVYLNIFGNNTERHVIRNFVNKIHAKVNDKRTNKTYDAFDPNLQLWVAATMYVCMLGSHQRVYGPLPEHEQEQVYQEFSVFGTSLQMPLSMWPDSRAAFASYWNDTIATLKVPNEAHNAVRDLFQPKYHKLPILVAVIMALLRPFSIAVASEELPGHVAVQFGFRSTWQTKALYKLMTTFNQWTFPLYPVWVRHMQKNYYLHTVRERMVNKGMMKNGKHVSTSSLGV